ncbi:MAG: hypothetical protein AAGE80_03965 [Pseudomonadota bacterium]
MTNTGLILGGIAVSSGIGAVVLVMSNLILWAAIAAWVGSMFAFGGFFMIVVALAVRNDEQQEAPARPARPAAVEPAAVPA